MEKNILLHFSNNGSNWQDDFLVTSYSATKQVIEVIVFETDTSTNILTSY